MARILAEREKVYLGALLHDNGKFWYRRGGKGTRNKHWVLSEAIVKMLFDDDLISDIVKNHHEEALKASTLTGRNRLLAEIVCDADTIASRAERTGGEDRSRRPLLSVFNLVKNFSRGRIQPICPLAVEKYEMPLLAEDYRYDELKQDYVERWEQFLKEFEEEAAYACNLTTLFYLYKKYLWCVPSAYDNTVPDISLFEHSRLTAAIALCLYDYFEKVAQGNLKNFSVKNAEEKRFLLMGADLNGIQGFIYNIAHDNALKALKGRSFYLQMLMENLAEKILEEFELPESNMLYCGGGAFYLLLPNLPDTEARIDEIGKNINELLLKEHFGLLSVTFASLPLSRNDFVDQRIINEKWVGLSDLLERNKNHKFAQTMNVDFFEKLTIPHGGVMICHATGFEICEIKDFENLKGKGNILYDKLEFKKFQPSSVANIYQIPDEDQGYKDAFISESQFWSIIIGHRLKQFKEVVSFRESNGEFNLPFVGTFDLLDKAQAEKGALSKAFVLNTDEFWHIDSPARGWKFYAGNWNPVKDSQSGRPVTAEFDYLRKTTIGIPYLAVLRMDVDNLSDNIRTGIDKPAFSRIVQLSNMLDFFFSGYLNKLQTLYWNVLDGVNNDKKGEPLAEAIQIIYAGGDDLCIVGKWNVIPDVAWWINNEFHDFVGGNPYLTLSAGISFFGAKYPLFKVAEEAGEAIDKAKNYQRQILGSNKWIKKNAICFLDNCMGWKDFETTKEMKNRFVQWVEGDQSRENSQTAKLPRGFLQLIQEIFFEFSGDKTIDDLSKADIERKQYGKWRWHAAYLLQRMGKRNHMEKELSEISSKLFTNHTTEKDYLLLLYTAAQWTDFLTRKAPDYDYT